MLIVLLNDDMIYWSILAFSQWDIIKKMSTFPPHSKAAIIDKESIISYFSKYLDWGYKG